jgi:hypothetical protein
MRPAVQVLPTADQLEWATQLGRADVVPDPVLTRRVEQAASATGARAIDVTVLATSHENRHVPVVVLQATGPASYMKHRLRGFLKRVGFLEAGSLGFVELLDEHGRFAWAAGYWWNGGMVHSRPDLDPCSPIVHSQPLTLTPRPQCPAK